MSGSHNSERDDLTTSEKLVNLILFGIFLIIFIVFIAQLRKLFKVKSKNYIPGKMHYFIILLIFCSLVSR